MYRSLRPFHRIRLENAPLPSAVPQRGQLCSTLPTTPFTFSASQTRDTHTVTTLSADKDALASEFPHLKQPQKVSFRTSGQPSPAPASVMVKYIEENVPRESNERRGSLSTSEFLEIAQNAPLLYTQDNIRYRLIKGLLSLSKDDLRRNNHSRTLRSLLSAIAEMGKKTRSRDVVALFEAFVQSNSQKIDSSTLPTSVVKLVLDSMAKEWSTGTPKDGTLQALVGHLELLVPTEFASMTILIPNKRMPSSRV